jgi:two-component system response regulator NreC
MALHSSNGSAPRARATSELDGETAVRIILTDDHDAVRRRLRLCLDDDAGLDVVAEVTDMASVVRRVRGFLANVLVVDLGMLDNLSIELLRRMRAMVPETKIVVVASGEDPVFARRALDAGATGFVVRQTAEVELSLAVHSVARGEQWVSPSVCVSLASLRDGPRRAQLTPRELEVLRLIALGYTSVEVGERLDLSPRTIESHRGRIHRKLDVTSRAGLVGYALEHGLVGTAAAAG